MKGKKGTFFLLITVVSILLFAQAFAGEKGENMDKSIVKKFKLQPKEDKQKGIITYMPKGSNSRSRVVLYIVKIERDNSYILRLRIAYFAEEMLFIKQYIFTADDKEYILPMREMTRQVDLQKMSLPGVYYDQEGGGICEYYDVAILPQEIEILRQVSASKSAKMEYVGTKGNQKVSIHKDEIKDINRVFDAFDAFKAEAFK